MAEESSEQERRSRHACESCRTRKTKCPAERPVCSICQRMNQQCVYLPRDQSRRPPRVNKATRKPSKSRVQHLESQMNDIYAMLHSISRPNASTDTSPDFVAGAARDDASAGIDATVSADIDSDILDHAVHVYKTKIHLQPLPLLSLEDLPDRLARGPTYLRWAFLALCLNFTAPEIPLSPGREYVQHYSQSAHEAVVKLAMEGIATAEILQALCLLALSDMKGGKLARAWMIIGNASTLQTIETSKRSQTYLHDSSAEKEVASRCYWSIFILERMFLPQPKLAAFGRVQRFTPDYPVSPPSPLPLSSDTRIHSERHAASDSIKDIGIIAHCLLSVSVWRDLTTYLHEIQFGNTESAWVPSSTYSQLNLQMHENQTICGSPHLFRNLSLRERSAADFLEHREYWTSWALMQVASHAIPAVLNHPFIHLVVKRPAGSTHNPKPTFFLQQTVDLAIFHSGWVARLLRVFDSFPFQLTNPVVGHMIAATATVFWLFQFVRDTKVSIRAKEDLEKSESFLERMAPECPHVAQKLKILRELQAKVQGSRHEGDSGNRHRSGWESATTTTTITFQPSDLWALLDSSLSQMASSNSVSPTPALPAGVDDNSTSISLNVHVVPPWTEGQDDSRQSTSAPIQAANGTFPVEVDATAEDPFHFAGTGGFDIFLDDLFTPFNIDTSDGNPSQQDGSGWYRQ
ncbi:hypothetical protein EDD37DRAFT_84703 [Exophiala viscosa]|uniref:uncharacterized protein n=1 Tax=Exophiala viscosa TaxID=2486360 RepID=UPI00218D3FF6|nr:hypothetical protein EDD37DRAFT_84703 [Exophiala viscosa]